MVDAKRFVGGDWRLLYFAEYNRIKFIW